MHLPADTQAWTREGFLISTDKNLLSLDAINAAFAQDFLYWAQPFLNENLHHMIDKSFCFGLYKTAAPAMPQIGFARLITDEVSFAYLDDVYVLPEYQGIGLGGWLLDAVDELVRPLPHLRWIMLRTSSRKCKEWYERRMDMELLVSDDPNAGRVMMGRRGKNMA